MTRKGACVLFPVSLALFVWGLFVQMTLLGELIRYAKVLPLLVMSVLMVVIVALQPGKDKRLSGAIAGGADTFFGKTKGNTMDKLFSKLTIIGSVLITVIVLALYVLINWYTLAA